MEPTTDNEEQDRFWNDVAGPLWVSAQDETDRHTGPFGDAALEIADPQPGERVLDVGCGCGTTALDLAIVVGTTGAVLGVDLSSVMLQRAEERAAAVGLTNLTFRRLDAQRGELGHSAFDLVFSRFGVMFFADPTAAFAHLRAALRPAGRLVFVCWQPPSANPWMAIPNRTAMRFFDLTPPPHDAPGPFSLADPQRIRALLTAGGFAGIEITPIARHLSLAAGQSLHDWVHHRLLMGPARDRYLGGGPEVQTQVRQAVVDAVKPNWAADRLEITGASWVVAARGVA